MLAARDQENRVLGHSLGGHTGKPRVLGPKTPLQVPLKDASGASGTGKRGLAQRPGGGNENLRTVGNAGKSALVTPMEPRTARAPLGNKTTNAKAHAQNLQNNGLAPKGGRAAVQDIVRAIEKSQEQQTQQTQQTQQKQQNQQKQNPPKTGGGPASVRRARIVSPRSHTSKLSVLSDETVQTAQTADGGENKKDECEIEYAPPPVPAQPYASDVFPDGVLTYAALRPENRLRGYYDYYYDPIDEDGVRRRDKERAEQTRRALETLDLRVQADMNALDWSVGDVPATRLDESHTDQATTQEPAPPVVTARRAAAALATPAASISHRRTVQNTAPPKPVSTFLSSLPLPKTRATSTTRPANMALPLRPKSSIHHPVAAAASRTTLGYTKGRTVSSAVRNGGRVGASTKAIRPANTLVRHVSSAQASMSGGQTSSWKTDADCDAVAPQSPAFVSIFDVAADDIEEDWGGASTVVDDVDDEFQMETVY